MIVAFPIRLKDRMEMRMRIRIMMWIQIRMAIPMMPERTLAEMQMPTESKTFMPPWVHRLIME